MSNSEPPSRKIWNWYPYKTNLLSYFTKFSSYHKFALKKVLFPFPSLVFYDFLSTWLAKIIYHIIVFDNSFFSFFSWDVLFLRDNCFLCIYQSRWSCFEIAEWSFEVSTNFLFQKSFGKKVNFIWNWIIAPSFGG